MSESVNQRVIAAHFGRDDFHSEASSARPSHPEEEEREILQSHSRLTGLPAPKVRLPHVVPLAAAAVSTFVASWTGRPPRVPLESVRMSRHRMFFSAAKAVRELHLPQTPVEDALSRAVAWFRENGYVAAR